MRRIIVLLIGAALIFSLFGCSKHPTGPSLTLFSDEYSSGVTTLFTYKKEGNIKIYEGEIGSGYLQIKQGNKLQYKFFNEENEEDADRSILLIQKSNTKEKVKEIVLDNNSVETSLPKGKYIYNFLIEWKNGSVKFITIVEIE